MLATFHAVLEHLIIRALFTSYCNFSKSAITRKQCSDAKMAQILSMYAILNFLLSASSLIATPFMRNQKVRFAITKIPS